MKGINFNITSQGLSKLLLASFLLFFVDPAKAQNTWQQIPSFPGPARDDAAAFAVGGAGFVGTGLTVGFALSKDFWKYENGAWTQVADFGGTERQYAATFTANGKGYLFGGIDINTQYVNDLWEFDPPSNTWSQKTSLPAVGRSGAAAFAVGNIGYVGTGRNNNTYLNDFWQYNTQSDNWTQLPDFPGSQRFVAVAFSAAGNGYIGTGRDAASQHLQDFYVFDTGTAQWNNMPAFPGTARASAEGFSLSLSGIVGAGWDNNANYLDDFWQYDPASSNWIQLSNLPTTPRKGGAGFVANGLVYFGTGIDSGNNRLDDFWEYTPFTGLQPSASLNPGVYPNPSSGKFGLTFGETKRLRIAVYSPSGKRIYETDANGSGSVIDLSGFPDGIYLCGVTDSTSKTETFLRLVKNQ